MYGNIASVYHLIYPNWEKSIRRQASMLDAVIRERWGSGPNVLDVSCGIGTQALGLAEIGYAVTASDLSEGEVNRAKIEASKLDLRIDFSVADMREAFLHHRAESDIVICCDNSLPHLTTDDDILRALRQFHLCTKVGGGCIVSVRDYDNEDITEQQVRPCTVRDVEGVRWLIWQVWDPDPPLYDLTMYFVEDSGSTTCTTYVMRSTYYAIGTGRLIELMKEAGFSDVERIDGRFFQPLIVGTRTSK